MNKILTILKCIKGIVGLIIGILIIAFVVNLLHDKGDPGLIPLPQENKHRIMEMTYRPPIISLPWQKDKAPIKEEKLPIPKKRVDKVIQIEVPIPGSEETITTEIIIDKKGEVYKATDTPEDTRIKVTKYKPRLFDLDFRLGYSCVVSDHIYHCLSFDYLRAGRFYLGSEFGIAQKGNSVGGKYLIGLSLKYKIFEIGDWNKSGGVGFNAVAGWNLMGNMVYGGFNIKW